MNCVYCEKPLEGQTAVVLKATVVQVSGDSTFCAGTESGEKVYHLDCYKRVQSQMALPEIGKGVT